MRDLLRTLRKTLLDIGNFGLLLLLFMFIYVLIGVQFFANRFHFGEDGKVIGIGEEGYYDAEVPRSNFDTLLHAFVTVFEASGVVCREEGWCGFVSSLGFASITRVAMIVFVAILKLAGWRVEGSFCSLVRVVVLTQRNVGARASCLPTVLRATIITT